MYELSVHLNIAHNSFALVRVLRAGAFCLFQFIFERSNKEPSPERVRSERGREDKPLTPVLYSTREGGELYGAIISAAANGDTTAMCAILKHYEGYIAKLCTRTLKDDAGNTYSYVDEEMRNRLQVRLITRTLAFHVG